MPTRATCTCYPSLSMPEPSMHRTMFFCSLLLLGFLSAPVQAADAFQVKDNTGKYADVLTPDGKPILRYMYERDTSDDAQDPSILRRFLHMFLLTMEKRHSPREPVASSRTTAESSLVGINSSREARVMIFGMSVTRSKNTVNLKQRKQLTKAPRSLR